MLLESEGHREVGRSSIPLAGFQACCVDVSDQCSWQAQLNWVFFLE